MDALVVNQKARRNRTVKYLKGLRNQNWGIFCESM